MTLQQHHRERKNHIRSFMRAHYTDERLAWLLSHARAGILDYLSCCCFIGIPTADHALRGKGVSGLHYDRALSLPGAAEAEESFLKIYHSARLYFPQGRERDDARIRILIPMVKAEMRRRERERAQLAAIEPQSFDLRPSEILSLKGGAR